jgi:hypothetical protein
VEDDDDEENGVEKKIGRGEANADFAFAIHYASNFKP